MSNDLKRVGILTLNGYNNYGNRLQNYATQEVLKKLGFQVETILVDRTDPNSRKLSNRLRKISSINELCKKISNKIEYYLNKDIIKERQKTFLNFSKQNINETDYTISNNYIPNDLSNKYDYFIVGSDQVWNPYNLHGTSFYFLTFVKETYKKIAYAASFGISEIPAEFKERYKEWLSGMHRISVREDDGAKIIKELTGRDAPVLVDPTMLLTKEKWLSIAKPAKNKPQGRYLLTYFLGGIPAKYKKQIRNIVKKNNLEVINLGDIREKETYETGPSEFIDYINSCSIVCTDSFHGTVFSIVFEKPFIVYERIGSSSSMYSRIDTLLNKFDLNSRKAENIKTNNDVFDIDYSHVPPILEQERKKAIDYLKEALNVKDDN